MSPSIAPLLRHGAVAVAIAGVLVSSVILTRGRAAVAQETPPTEVVAGSAPASGLGGKDFIADRDAIFNAFYTTGLDTTKPYSVSNLAIRKDNMTLLLRQGTVFLMRPIAGEVTGAAFVGEGEAQMTPPNRMERYMLNKYYGAEVLKEPFSEAVFRFTDGTDKAIVLSGKPDPAGAGQATRAAEVLKERNAWLNGTRDIFSPNLSLHLEFQFLENRISGLKGADFFLADFNSAKHKWLTYRFNPAAIHEHLLYTSETLGSKSRRYLIPWVEWHRQGDYAPSGHYVMHPERDGPRTLRVRHNEMTINLPTTKSVDWEAKMRIEPLVDLRAMRFDVVNNAWAESRWYDQSFNPCSVKSVSDEAGTPLAFSHKKDELLVILPQPARAGVAITLIFKGSAEVIRQITAESFGLHQATWYPAYGYVGGRATFHWTVRVPKPYLITGSGKVVREEEDKAAGQNVLEIRSDLPVTFPWLIFGRFQKANSTYVGEDSKKTVALTVHSFPNMTVTITDPDQLEELGLTTATTFVLTAPLKKVNGFFDEGKQVLKLYEKIYGPYPYDELHIAQMGPGEGYGQGPPWFVQLTGEAFMSQAELLTDTVHGFFAHEIGHQWWGNQVGWASDDDAWLSEAFAEYAAGLFVKELQGAKRFQRTLDEWRRDAKYNDKEAPIAAASTLAGPNGPDQRQGLLYAKGPYVLHMLRVQLDDAKYVEVMKSIQQNYQHQNLSTEMVLREINRVSGADYTSFFDQWVWDTGVPVFRYSWRSEKQPDGKFLVTIHVSQEDKARVKKVLLPIHLHVKDKPIPTQYRPVIQAEQDIKLLLPMEPKNVTLDDERTLLAEFVKE